MSDPERNAPMQFCTMKYGEVTIQVRYPIQPCTINGEIQIVLNLNLDVDAGIGTQFVLQRNLDQTAEPGPSFFL